MHWTPRRTPAFNFSLKAAQKSCCFSRVYVGVYVTHPLTLTCTPVPHTTNSLARSLTHSFAPNPSHSLPLVCADQGVEGWTQTRVRTGAGGVNDGTYSTEGRLQFTNSTCLKRRMAGGALPSLNAVRGTGGGSRSADSEGGKSCSDKAAFVYGTLGIAHLLRRPAEEDRTYGRLGICHMYLGDYAKTAAYCERCHVIYI